MASCLPLSIPGSPAVHVSVLVLNHQTGGLPLQLAKARPIRQIGAQQQTTQYVSVRGRKESADSGVHSGVLKTGATEFHSLLVALDPSLTTGIWTAVSFLRAFRIQLFVAESVG